ncbi:MAG: glycosyltransferase family 2 protein [Pseudomonadota bacterium]
MITKNEANNIEACLRSVLFADQMVVLDSGSTDNTQQLARGLGAEVSEERNWQGFGVQKNRALALARCDWVLSIDADERVTPSLRAEILKVIANPSSEVYTLSRLSSYCGQYMMHSGWSPDHVTRLFRRGAAAFSDELVHEKLLTSHPVRALTAPLLHESFLNFEAVLEKANRYSTAGAYMLREKGKSASVGTAIAHGAWAFFRTYVLRRGFLDGKMGLVLAISNAEGTYYRYLKLWLMSAQTARRTEVARSTSSGKSTH